MPAAIGADHDVLNSAGFEMDPPSRCFGLQSDVEPAFTVILPKLFFT